MKENDVKLCLNELMNKRCEGFDRIPLCVIRDACNLLLSPMAQLFDNIYNTCTIPDQWKVSKIIPIFKKGFKVLFAGPGSRDAE